MNATLSPEKNPAGLLAPGLLAAVGCSAVLACLQATFGQVPGGLNLSGTALLVISGVVGAFGAFFAVLLYSVLIWIYGKALQSVRAGFVQTLAVVALALGATTVLQLGVVGAEILVTGAAPTLPFTNLSRLAGLESVKVDVLNGVTVALVYLGVRRYLGYGVWAAGILAFLMLAVNVAVGSFA